MAERKQLNPGDMVLGLGEETNLRMRSGLIVSVTHGGNRECHMGCEHRLLVLWAEPVPHLVLECDCGILVPADLNF